MRLCVCARVCVYVGTCLCVCGHVFACVLCVCVGTCEWLQVGVSTMEVPMFTTTDLRHCPPMGVSRAVLPFVAVPTCLPPSPTPCLTPGNP